MSEEIFCQYCHHPSCAGCTTKTEATMAIQSIAYAPIPRVIAGLLRVLNGEGDKKHGDNWKTRSDREDMCHIMQHDFRADNPEYRNYDDQGDPHQLKSLCRRALKLERWMIAEEERVEDTGTSSQATEDIG